jgi:hypothetical protein
MTTHPTFAKAHALLADRDEQEREHAQWLEEHRVELENTEADELLARLEARRQTPSDALVYKDCHANFSDAPPDPIFSYDQQRTLVHTISLLREELRKAFAKQIDRQGIDIAAIIARLDGMQADIDELASRVDELETQSNGTGNGGYLG